MLFNTTFGEPSAFVGLGGQLSGSMERPESALRPEHWEQYDLWHCDDSGSYERESQHLWLVEEQ